MASAAKAELTAIFIAAREMVTQRQTLIDMGWPQPRSPIQTDNSTAIGVTNKTVVPCPQEGQNDGHETVVAMMSQLPKTVSLLLKCRVKELG